MITDISIPTHTIKHTHTHTHTHIYIYIYICVCVCVCVWRDFFCVCVYATLYWFMVGKRFLSETYSHTDSHTHTHTHTYIYIHKFKYYFGSGRDVKAIVEGDGHGDTPSNPWKNFEFLKVQILNWTVQGSLGFIIVLFFFYLGVIHSLRFTLARSNNTW